MKSLSNHAIKMKICRRWQQAGFALHGSCLTRQVNDVVQVIKPHVTTLGDLQVFLGLSLDGDPGARGKNADQCCQVFSILGVARGTRHVNRTELNTARLGTLAISDLNEWCERVFVGAIEPFFQLFVSASDAARILKESGEQALHVNTLLAYRERIGTAKPRGEWSFKIGHLTGDVNDHG